MMMLMIKMFSHILQIRMMNKNNNNYTHNNTLAKTLSNKANLHEAPQYQCKIKITKKSFQI